MSIITIIDAKGKKHKVDTQEIFFRKAIYGIYLKSNKLLMVKDKLSNKWEIPGGGVENNELPIEALKREFFEETGLKILDKKIYHSKILYSCEELFFDITSRQAWKTKRDFFLISQVKGKINNQKNKEDVINIKFFSLDELPFSNVAQTIQQVLKKLLKLYKKRGIFKINS